MPSLAQAVIVSVSPAGSKSLASTSAMRIVKSDPAGRLKVSDAATGICRQNGTNAACEPAPGKHS